MIIAIIGILAIFVKEIYKLNELKINLKTNYDFKETKELLSTLNSAKKSIIKEINRGPFIINSDINVGDHYE